MLLDPGAMAAPIKEMIHEPTSRILRAWNVSEAEEMTGPRTAWTSESALGTHVWAATPSRSAPILANCARPMVSHGLKYKTDGEDWDTYDSRRALESHDLDVVQQPQGGKGNPGPRMNLGLFLVVIVDEVLVCGFVRSILEVLFLGRELFLVDWRCLLGFVADCGFFARLLLGVFNIAGHDGGNLVAAAAG